jgi:predicted ester cyclase
MGMEGFAPEFETPEQYIIDITYKIWEERGVGRIRDWYAPDAIVRRPHSVSHTVGAVISHTLEAMAEFPDQEALAEDVIIGERPDGFLSSHRVRGLGTHLGEGFFGPATRRPICTLTVADCLCRENRIVDEWLLGDQAGLVMQLGLDPVAFGSRLGRQDRAAYTLDAQTMRQRWADPRGLVVVGDPAIANRILDTYTAIWQDKNLNVMADTYDRAARFEGPSNHLCFSRANAGNWFYRTLAAVPDGRFEPHHLIVREQPERPVRVALRWSYSGTHSGVGRYGAPSGVPVVLLGISHFELRDGRIVNEWLVMDEVAVYAQIAAHQRA